MKHIRARLPVIAVLALLVLVIAAGTVLAATYVGGSLISQVRIARHNGPTTTSSQAFVDIPGATATLTVASGRRAVLMARFSAESACWSTSVTTSSAYCSVRILVVGPNNIVYPMQPIETSVPFADMGKDFAFDSTNGGAEKAGSWESHSMDRSFGPTAGTLSGAWKMRVQYRTTAANIRFRVDDWSLTAEMVNVP